MKQVLLIIDVQHAFSPPAWLITGLQSITHLMPSIATIELHDEEKTPFLRQLGWAPPAHDECLVNVDRVFAKHGYGPPSAVMQYLNDAQPDRVLVAGIQTETCCLAAGFALFDAGMNPALITNLTVGSSLDRSGQLGIRLWMHHFGNVVTLQTILQEYGNSPSANHPPN